MTVKTPITLFPEHSPLLLTRRAAMVAAAASGAVLLTGCGPSSRQDVPSNPTQAPTKSEPADDSKHSLGPEPKKPVLYLYPEAPTDLEVRLEYNGQLTYCYPEPERRGKVAIWRVHAATDGTLTDASGRHYPSLFWEGKNAPALTQNEGFVVETGQETAFLEHKLALLGLTQREAADFITYWAPQLAARSRSLVTFATDWYTQVVRYTLTDTVTGAVITPDTFIRVFMLIGDAPAGGVPEQNLTTAPERTGFTAVEWGGALLS
ncbi:Uncharacterised protein [Actinomyces bovis]|uniref:Transcriptional initiation protein Tat n=1 Tax=Actinomyces bovis TaxID=1658 RepID=A0ABY1VJU9_9ACTO|nr:transcriptional initiation protein Tat [Actinomyces bovis]SPT52383.1 Uncharacterised protein [Actinomyces bovis]VEG53975.1 Uncharacterised protein [Actinomyces israelii]